MSAVELYSKGARVWLPDPDVVWRGAELLEDYKDAPCKLKVQYEEGEIGQFYIDSDHSYHAAIGMHSAKEQVRVILDAKMPNV